VRGAFEAKRLRALVAIAAGALAIACALAPRTATACSCGLRAAWLVCPPPGGSHPVALPLLITAPSETDIRIEDDAGQSVPLRRLIELPYLGLCGMPQFLIALDEEPVRPGRYRLVRGPDDGDEIELTAQALGPVPADLSVTLAVESHDALTPVGSVCADHKIDGRPFSRTAHLSFDFAATPGAAAMFATVAVSDPQTPGGLAQSMLLRPTDPTIGEWLIDLPLEDGAESCATATVWDATGKIVLADKLCTAEAPETRSVGVRALVPAGSPIVARGFGCSVAAGHCHGGASLMALLSVAFAFLRIRRPPHSPGRMLRRCRLRPPRTSTPTG
jgi:hypothetical protein